jgi:hypothetical protein
MDEPGVDPRHVTIHLAAQATVDFGADQLWPRHGEYGRFGTDLAAFAEEVVRRLRTESCVGFSGSAEQITVIPMSVIKRIDFTRR